MTAEAARRYQALLAPDGTLIINAIGPAAGDGGRFIASLAATFASVFADVGLYPLGSPEAPQAAQNVMLVARNRPGPLPEGNTDELRRFLGRRQEAASLAGGFTLTDEYAPVEWLCAMTLGDD